MRLWGAVAVASLVFASTASATTLYVATSGNDASSGAIDAPFRTISKASQIAKAGDVVNVRGGIYTDKVSISSKGTAAAPIVFRAMAGENVVLDGSSLGANIPVVSLNNTAYVDFSGFEVRNANYMGILMWYAKNTRVLNNNVHGATRNGIYAGGDAIGDCADITISGNTVHDAVLENQFHTMTTGGWAGALVVARTNRATVTNNRVYNNDGEGIIFVRSNYATIQSNEISDNFSSYIYLDNARYATVNGNLVYSTANSRYYRDGKPGAGISIANETSSIMNPSSDNVITNNIVVGTKWGFYYGAYESGGGLKNTKVVNNTFYGTTDEIVRVENDAHANSTIANNIFYQTGPTPKYSGAPAVSYRSNLWYGGAAGVAAGTADVLANPLLARAGGFTANDYRLTALSPAIHTAADLISDVTTDYFGSARTPSFDIGAHELSLSLGSGAAASADPSSSAPSSVQAMAISSSAVVVSWAASGAQGYNVYRDGKKIASAITTTSTTDAGLTASTKYMYEVTSIDAAGNESLRIAAYVTTPEPAADTQAPTAPESLSASSVTRSTLTLGWAASVDNVRTTGYMIYRNGVHIASTMTPSFADQALTAGTTYTYYVVAMDAAGNSSGQSNTISVTTDGSKNRASKH